MAPKSKSIFRQPGVQHFQLVHRSQRDPLIHDPDASQHVLKPFLRENDKKGKSRAQLEQLISPSDLAHDTARNVGEATLYGVYFDDTEYDYMQHLRPVGVQEDGVESTLIEAPSRQSKSKGKDKASIALRDLPAEALPSTSELPRNYENQQAVPSSIAGFQPNMDPHLRQTLEALEDDAFVEDELEDDFLAELVRDGERDALDAFSYEFIEDGLPEGAEGEASLEGGEELNEDAGWEAHFAAFKKKQKAETIRDDVSDEDGLSDDRDTVGQLPEFSVMGGKKRRRGDSDASGYSMTSSSMFRTDGLRLLDDRFEQFEKQYDEDETIAGDSESDDDAPDLITSREDFEALMDDFLDNYEIHGGKLKPSLEGVGAEKLEVLRLAMGRDERVRPPDRPSNESSDDDDIYAALEKEDKHERWDVETVLTTHTNLENHPRLIRARETKPVPKIRLDPRTGLPTVLPESTIKAPKPRAPSPEDEPREVRHTVARAREESKEDKKARKQAVKQEKQLRRVEKKVTKQQFSIAVKQQSQLLASKDVRIRKL